MSDVEGVRNLIGTGLVDLVGGLLTACIALVILFRISALMTGLAFGFLLFFALALKKAFQTIRPIFRERGKILAGFCPIQDPLCLCTFLCRVDLGVVGNIFRDFVVRHLGLISDLF